MANKITRADHGRRSGSRPHGYKNGSTFKRHIDEAAELMRKVVNGDVTSFGYLYDEFCPILRCLFATCIHRHMSLDDFSQEVFTRLWQQRKNYRGTSYFLTYLLGIARYMLNEALQREQKN